jgi:hypothetical protein
MVVGDVVNGMAAASAALTFIPAAGVEVCITSIGSYGNWVQLASSVGVSLLFNMTILGGVNVNMKLFINNTNYIAMVAAGAANNSYTGIQIK